MLFRRLNSTFQRWSTPRVANATRKRNATYILGAFAGIGGLYYYSNLETVPISGRVRFNDVSHKSEMDLSKMLYSSKLAEYRNIMLPPNHPQSIIVAKVAQRLIRVADLNADWKIHVVDDPNIPNAFVIPGGKIFVFTGIFPFCKNEDGLAAVLAHEISHVIARHSAETFAKAKLLTIFSIVMHSMFYDLRFLFSGGVLDLVFSKPFKREMETEADLIGLMLMQKAGFNMHEAIGLWKRMENSNLPKMPEYVSTHPSGETRIRNITRWIDDIQRGIKPRA